MVMIMRSLGKIDQHQHFTHKVCIFTQGESKSIMSSSSLSSSRTKHMMMITIHDHHLLGSLLEDYCVNGSPSTIRDIPLDYSSEDRLLELVGGKRIIRERRDDDDDDSVL